MATHLDDPSEFTHIVIPSTGDGGGYQDKASLAHDSNRIQRNLTAWRFYLGEHWEFDREDGEPLVTINYVGALIDKKISFLVGADFTVTVPPALTPITLPLIQKAWEENGRQILNYEMAQQGSVTGDIFVLVMADNPLPEQLRFDPLAKYRIVLHRFHSEESFPEWEENAPNTKYGRPMRKFRHERVFQKVDKNGKSIDVKYTLEITADYFRYRFDEGPWTTQPNRLKEISVVHIKNKPAARTSYGIDDITDLIPLNRDLNEKATDISDTINYNGQPITVFTGGARSQGLERSPKAIWQLPVGGKAEYLTLDSDLAASVNYMETLKTALTELANVPVNALAGDNRKVTGTTGETWSQQLVPMVDERNKKRATYEPGYERINYFILRYEEELNGLRLPAGICSKCGGKIAIFYVEDPDNPGEKFQVRKCYQLDPETFGFLDPDKMKIPFLREHSQGPEVAKVPTDQAFEESKKQNSSFWDMAPTKPVDNALPAPEEAESYYQLPPGFKYPPEPERFDLEKVEVVYDDILVKGEDGEDTPLVQVVQKKRTNVFAIPVECDQHSYLNPFTNYVKFNETLPKDVQKQAELFRIYADLEIMSQAAMMREIGVENVEETQDEIMRERQNQAPPLVSPAEGTAPGIVPNPNGNQISRPRTPNPVAKKPNKPVGSGNGA